MLDSSTGFHSANDRGEVDYWCIVELPEVCEIHELILTKRGDGYCWDRLILNFNL